MDITVVYPPTVDYFWFHQRPHHIMMSFARHGINSIFINSEKYSEQKRLVYTPDKTIYNFKVVSAKNNVFKSYVKGKLVVWVNDPAHIDLVKKWNPQIVIYDAVDMLDGRNLYSETLAQEVHNKSHAVFASSKHIVERSLALGRNAIYLPNGADYWHFSAAAEKLSRPNDIPFEYPIVGYYGTISDIIDVDFVLNIAKKYKVVMVGATQDSINIDHPNVIILPHKTYDELPYYLSHFDVVIIPYKLSNAIGSGPVKFYEYLAAGKPVVSTRLKELEQFDSLCYFADSSNAADVVTHAISVNNDELASERQSFAEANSWNIRVHQALQEISGHLEP